jgi:hypothetical protein
VQESGELATDRGLASAHGTDEKQVLRFVHLESDRRRKPTPGVGFLSWS